MKNTKETIFGISKDELYNVNIHESFKHKEELKWIRQLIVYFYSSLKEYKNRYFDNIIIETSQSLELNSNLGEKEYTYLDLLLSFVNFYKKNKNTILYKHIEHKSNQVKKPKWEKTINKSLPLVLQSNEPIYTEIRSQKKVINNEEELITYFFSILNHFNKEHQLYLQIDSSFYLIKGNSFEKLQNSGLVKLRKIKHRYFSDTFKRMYRLCEIYFQQTDSSSIKKKKEEFISVKNYNIIFEDMVDKLFSEKLTQKFVLNNESISLDDLKYNNDGKIIDHIYEDQSLIDTSNIFYIGDSKYYKTNSEAGKVSKYKQFTYAKNIIQFNIDLLNEKKVYTPNIRYRDAITEGYNLTPNFFIYGYIDDFIDFDNPRLEQHTQLPVKSFHFENRLFDRDTLFVHQYKMNFLFILKSYTTFNQYTIKEFRDKTKADFRNQFLSFFNDKSLSGFEIFEKEMDKTQATEFVNLNFRQLNGKIFYTNNGKLLIAKHCEDNNLPLTDFQRKTLE